MKKILISGGWDIMHYNHVLTLQRAKALGDYLVVNVLSDERMKFKKGEGRPLIPLKERMLILAELKSVDEVMSIPGKEYPLYKAIDLAKPDAICINVDEQADVTKEQEYCDAHGVELIKIHRIDDGISTTKLLEMFKK